MKWRDVVAGGLWLLLGGCAAHVASPSAPPGLPLAPEARATTVAPPAPRTWSATDRLVWAEFLGTAPVTGIEGARTVYELRYASRCHGTAFTFDVTAVFLSEQSWVKADVLASPRESARVLQHEQTHFDLTEVYARRMRKYFRELYDPCGQPEATIDAAIDRFVREEAEAQQRYDDESGYGLVAARQQAWTERVAEWLAGLASFARPAAGS